MKEGNMKDNRLSNLSKLYHVPVFAIQELLERHVPDRKFGHLSQSVLISEVDKVDSITEEFIDQLYENYRYGRRLSFYLYLLPEGLSKPDIDTLQTALNDVGMSSEVDISDLGEVDQDYEYDQSPDTVILLDEEVLNDITEFRFRYFVLRRFLNDEEQPDQVLQTRYGFLWLDVKNGHLTILSRDERINRVITKALATCLQAIPLPVRLSKDLINKHFPIEKVKRVSHFDPLKGIRQALSGRGLWENFKSEIETREKQYQRPSSLYDEQIALGVNSGLGITASKGKIYLTRTLPTSLVRAWAKRRLPELINDLKDVKAEKPEIFNRSIEAINRMRLKSIGKAAVNTIIEGLLTTNREDATSAELSQSALGIYQALEGKYLDAVIASICSECEEMANSCMQCEGQNILVDGNQVICKDCKAVISKDGYLSLRCMNGHIHEYSLNDSLILNPNSYFLKRVGAVFGEIGQKWDEDEDYFLIEGYVIHHFKRGSLDKAGLPHQIYKFYTNIERIEGPVHTGKGDININ